MAGRTGPVSAKQVAFPQLDVATINADPPTDYTQVTDPSLGFDSQGNVYVLTLQTTGRHRRRTVPDPVQFLRCYADPTRSPEQWHCYQWVTGSDAATSPVLAVDTANPAAPGPRTPHANNVYIAWASIDTEPANPNPYTGPASTRTGPSWSSALPFPIRQGTRIVGFQWRDDRQCRVATSAPAAQRRSHPQLVINQNDWRPSHRCLG